MQLYWSEKRERERERERERAEPAPPSPPPAILYDNYDICSGFGTYVPGSILWCKKFTGWNVNYLFVFLILIDCSFQHFLRRAVYYPIKVVTNCTISNHPFSQAIVLKTAEQNISVSYSVFDLLV